MVEKENFKTIFQYNWLEKGDIFEIHNGLANKSVSTKMLITSNPRQIWWQRLIQFLTVGIYKAPWIYKAKILEQIVW